MPINVDARFAGDTIIVDSREKPRAIGRILKYFDDNQIRYVVSKLYCGDYQLLSNGRFVVDRKQNLSEICANLTYDHERFRREAQRAQEIGIQLVVLIEEGLSMRSVEDVKNWINPRTWNYCRSNGISTRGDVRENIREFVSHGGQKPPQSGEWLAKTMTTMTERYGIRWEFCGKRDTGWKIAELLWEGKQHAAQ